MTTVKNVKTLPEVFFGLHMVEGTAEYTEPGKDPYRIYIAGDTIKNMNPSFKGKPVFVCHVDEVDLENLQEKADGWVVRSFFNSVDGKNWVEFLAVSDRSKEAIRKGWRLSNAYIPKTFASGGENHGVSYSREVTSGEYEHLAIVEDPRYEESIILTPEQFKQYNEEKTQELTRLANSKEKETKKMGLNIFKRTKVENAKDVDFDELMVELPLSKKEMTLAKVVNEYDKVLNMHGYANGEHAVKCNGDDGEEEMSVNELVKKYNKMKNAEKERMEAEEAAKNGEDEDSTIEEAEKDVGDRGGDKSLDNEDEDEDADDAAKKKKKNEAGGNDNEEARRKAAALKIANQRRQDNSIETARVDLGIDKVARGKARYGS